MEVVMEAVKKGNVLVCSECGVELEVTRSCDCTDCEIVCCGKAMEVRKKSAGGPCCC